MTNGFDCGVHVLNVMSRINTDVSSILQVLVIVLILVNLFYLGEMQLENEPGSSTVRPFV